MAQFDNDNNNIFREVSRKSNIVDVVSYYLGGNNLVRKGKIYLSVCPFHHDTHPSMRVDPERNTYKCFACGAGGDSIKFAQQYDHLAPFDALKKVAEICSITLPDNIRNRVILDPVKEKYAKELNALLDLRKFYQLTLSSLDGSPCQKYLAERKIPKEVIDHFELGFAPDNPKESIDKLRSMGHEVDTLINAGILAKGMDLADHYQHRLMFPIEDNFGHLVAFSGRILSKEQEGGKYVNYQETPLFHKNEVLYHFSKAREDAKRRGYIYVVEGFMDVIAIVRAGIVAVCGIMGTALTKEHALAFQKLGVEVRLCLDADEPGQIGEERACKMLHEYKIPFRIVRAFKNAKDSDEVLTKEGPEALQKQLETLSDPFLFFLRRALKGRPMLTDSVEILSFLRQAAPYFASLDAVSQDKDIQWVEKLCSLNRDTILSVLKNSAPSVSGTRKEEKESVGNIRFDNDQFRRRYRKNSSAPVSTIPYQMGPKYLQGKSVQQLYELAASQKDFALFSERLRKLECDIISVLPHSYEAFYEFQLARICIRYAPFYQLANFIATVYLKHPGCKLPFSDSDYDSLISLVKASSSAYRVPKEEEDPLGLGDDLFDDEDEDDSADTNLTDEDVEFLLGVISILRNFNEDCYDKNNFQNALKLHPLYVELQMLEEKEDSHPEQPLTKEEMKKKAKLKFAIRKNNGVI